MNKTMQGILRRAVRCFVAGVLAILPVAITVAVVAWVGGLLRQLIGPGTVIGAGLRRLGLEFASNDTAAYFLGVVIVLAVIFGIGVAVESGARGLIQRLSDAVLQRIPLVGGVYGTSKQVVGMLGRKDDAAIKGMRPVFCSFGQEAGAGFLALLVSPQRYRLSGRDYHIVIVPTSPVPIGGGLVFVPADVVQPTSLSVEALMSIYVSMGITAGQFLEPANRRPSDVLSQRPAAAVPAS
jgi:uncharacterized membrane protein